MPENKKAKSETAADGADVVLHAAETPAASESKSSGRFHHPTRSAAKQKPKLPKRRQ